MTTIIKAHANQKHYAGGFDTGNLHPKGFISPAIGELYGMSYCDTNPLHKDTTRLGCFQYLAGGNKFLTENPLIWTGSQVPDCARTINSYTRVGDKANGKIDLGLTMFLGYLSAKREHLRPEMVFHLVLSVVDAASVGDRMSEEFTGEHVIRIFQQNAKGKETSTDHKITIKVLKVVDEGAAVSQALQIPDLISLDIGNRTAIATAFSKGKILNRRAIDESGVESLVKRIASNNDLKSKLGSYDGDLHEVRKAIESYHQTVTPGKGKVKASTANIMEYRKKLVIDIWEIYQTEVQGWFDCELKTAVETVLDFQVKYGYPTRVFGGGALLPRVKDYFDKNGWVIAENPLFINAKGLCEIAEIMSGVAA